MKQFFKMFFASLLAMIVAGVIVFGLLIGLIVSAVSKSMSSDKESKVKASSILVIDLKKTFHEQGESNSLAAITDGSAFASGIYDITRSLAAAKKDDNIKGILLKLEETPNGWATSEQLREALLDFKSSNKFIYAYGEDIPQKAYYIATVADSIFANPVGGVELKGFATELAFFKGTLEKLEVQPEIYYAGKFKSATEPFRADKMSEPNRLQVMTLQGNFWNEFIAAVAKHAGTDAATVNDWTVKGLIQFPADALKYKLVDGIRYWDEVEVLLRSKTGLKKDEAIHYTSIDDYADNVKRNRKISEKKIALLFAEGNVVDGKGDDYQIASEDMAETIAKIRKDDKIKAVVLRVNSPGGSALASEVILRELQLLRQKKPLIVSMGDVAASGGYYIACQADSIFAMPYTITGSIGVFSMLFSAEGLMKHKLGVTFDGVKNAPYADIPTVSRTMTADEGQRMQNSVDNIYSIFKSRVSVGRKISVEEVDSIAQGRVWTGRDALKIKLIDGLGNLDRALQSAAAMAKLSDYSVSTYPGAVDKFESLMRKLKGNRAAAAAIQTTLQNELGSDYEYYQQLKQLRKMNGKAMMSMPFSYNMK
ncbi:MAG: signal peptide peptidase SppA [Bacteroidota bacterium]